MLSANTVLYHCWLVGKLGSQNSGMGPRAPGRVKLEQPGKSAITDMAPEDETLSSISNTKIFNNNKFVLQKKNLGSA